MHTYNHTHTHTHTTTHTCTLQTCMHPNSDVLSSDQFMSNATVLRFSVSRFRSYDCRVVGRGSVAQSCVATMIGFFFFSISFKEQPFKRDALNKIKCFSEFQLFAVLLVCTVMQANTAAPDFDDEMVDMDMYGDVLQGLTLLIIPVVRGVAPPAQSSSVSYHSAAEIII